MLLLSGHLTVTGIRPRLYAEDDGTIVEWCFTDWITFDVWI